MPRFLGGATHSQSYNVIGSGGSSMDRSGGGSELPRFERPVLKQAKSAYSSLTTTTTTATTPSSRDGHSSGMGFFRGRGSGGSSGRDELPLTTTNNNNNTPTSGSSLNGTTTTATNSGGSGGGGKPRGKVRAALPGREGVLPDWSRSTPSPSSSFDNHIHGSSGRSRTHSDVDGMSKSVPDVSILSGHHDYDTDEEERYPHHHRRDLSSSLLLEAQQQQQEGTTTNASTSSGGTVGGTTTVGTTTTTESRVLRQRKPMEDYPSPSSTTTIGRPPRQPNRASSDRSGGSGGGGGPPEDSPYRQHGHSRSSRTNSFRTLRHKLRSCCCKGFGGGGASWTVGHFLQATIIVLVTFLLYDSHHKADLIAQRLKEFKSEEAMVFLHLHRIEQQAIQLYESLQRIDTAAAQQQKQQSPTGGGGDDPNDNNNDNGDNNIGTRRGKDGEYLTNNKERINPPYIDSALIQKQTQQLMQMEEELSHEVRTLQTRIQHSAVRSIVHEYGEGPVQVTLEVVVDGQTSKISILLWHDTPHAAWTWLEQISHRLWDGAVIHLENNRLMNIASVHEETASSRLDFIERSQQRHEAWTVGLTESLLTTTTSSLLSSTVAAGGAGAGAGSGENNGVGGLELFINLQDNTEFSKHNVCVGKVFDGFDVLHKIVEQSRELQQAGGQPITIRTARASHLTNRETKGLI